MIFFLFLINLFSFCDSLICDLTNCTFLPVTCFFLAGDFKETFSDVCSNHQFENRDASADACKRFGGYLVTPKNAQTAYRLKVELNCPSTFLNAQRSSCAENLFTDDTKDISFHPTIWAAGQPDNSNSPCATREDELLQQCLQFHNPNTGDEYSGIDDVSCEKKTDCTVCGFPKQPNSDLWIDSGIEFNYYNFQTYSDKITVLIEFCFCL